MTAAFRSARAAAERGYAVFPTHWVIDGRCSCGKTTCPSSGKHPLTPNGVDDATSDERTLLHWKERWPDANWAVSCEKLAVVDIDSKSGADPREVIAEFEIEGRPTAWTGEAPEPSEKYPDSLVGVRGAHVYCNGPVRGGDTPVKGVEIRGRGHYVMLPGSRHESGVTYEWASGTRPTGDLGPVPEALLPTARVNGNGPAPELQETVAPGGRHHAMVSLAGSMRRRGCGYEEIHAALTAMNQARFRPPVEPERVEAVARDIAGRYKPAGLLTGDTREAPTGAPDGVVVTRASGVAPERVEWLWEGRVPLRAVTLIFGDPGVGKSLLTCWLAARVTRDHGVVVANAEDSPATTIVPRLAAAGADLDRVGLVAIRQDGVAGAVELPTHVTEIREAIVSYSAKLLVIDPLMAHLPGSIDSHKDQSIRRALAPLALLADEHRCAVVVVAHMNKAAGANAMYRVSGSIGIAGAVRSGLLFARDPDDPDGETGRQRVVASVKSSLGAPVESLSCAIEPVTLDGGLETAKLVMAGTSEHTGRELLAGSPDPEERSASEEAEEFLRAELEDGPRPAAELTREAKAAGVAEITLKRAKRTLKVKSGRSGGAAGKGKWEWALRGSSALIPLAEPADDPLSSNPGAARVSAPPPPLRGSTPGDDPLSAEGGSDGPVPDLVPGAGGRPGPAVGGNTLGAPAPNSGRSVGSRRDEPTEPTEREPTERTRIPEPKPGTSPPQSAHVPVGEPTEAENGRSAHTRERATAAPGADEVDGAIVGLCSKPIAAGSIRFQLLEWMDAQDVGDLPARLDRLRAAGRLEHRDTGDWVATEAT